MPPFYILCSMPYEAKKVNIDPIISLAMFYLVSPRQPQKVETQTKTGKRGQAKSWKKLAFQEELMYKFDRNSQISFIDFNQPLRMKMNANNRWVKKLK